MKTAPPTSAAAPAALPQAGLGAAPLFHAAWLFALGVTVAHWVWMRPGWVLLGVVLAGLVTVVAALGALRVAWIALGAVWLLLGAWCALVEPQPAPAPSVAALSDGLARTVEGVVVDSGPLRAAAEDDLDQQEAARRTAQRIDLRAEWMETVTDEADYQAPAEGVVRLTVHWPAAAAGAEPFRCGERVRAVARLLEPDTYRDPGVWSRREYLWEQGITATATVSAERIESLGPAPGLYPGCRVHALQHAASARLLALPARMRGLPGWLRLSQDDAIMLAAMATGDRTQLGRSLRAGFERTGSFHMLVVSGLHLAIVAGCLFWLARRLRLPRVPATLVTLAASFAYALFTGFATPVQRSLWMVTLYLLGRLVFRQRSQMNVIGFAALCLLAVSPRSLFDSSLQMTLLAVVTIGGIAIPLLEATVHPYLGAARDLGRAAVDVKLAPRLAQFRLVLRFAAAFLPGGSGALSPRRLFPGAVRWALRLGELLAVCCVVEVGMMLPMALYFHRITIFALPVNLLILPILTVLMPAVLVTLVALVVWPAAAVVPGAVAALFLHLGAGLVRWFGGQALGDYRIPAPLLWQSLAFCALLAAAIVLAHIAAASGRCWPRRLAVA
ncbi:MAG: ComEC/Rec2 family competence protein, partial [Terracidiphilus sp.]